MSTCHDILITAGLGDFIALVSFMSEEERLAIKTIYWATRARKLIVELIKNINIFPNLQKEVIVYYSFTGQDTDLFCFESKEAMLKFQEQKRITLSRNLPLQNICDYSIINIMRDVAEGKRTYKGLQLFEPKLADVSRLNLPKRYFFIHPYSQNARKTFRDVQLDEWSNIFNFLEKNNVNAVCISLGEERPPSHPLIVDLMNACNLLESIEILKNAIGYIGCSSCFSVLAPKFLNPNYICIKGHKEMVEKKTYDFYYPPHANPDLIVQKIGPNLLPRFRLIMSPHFQ